MEKLIQANTLLILKYSYKNGNLKTILLEILLKIKYSDQKAKNTYKTCIQKCNRI